jgi:hypothetical protein
MYRVRGGHHHFRGSLLLRDVPERIRNLGGDGAIVSRRWSALVEGSNQAPRAARLKGDRRSGRGETKGKWVDVLLQTIERRCVSLLRMDRAEEKKDFGAGSKPREDPRRSRRLGGAQSRRRLMKGRRKTSVKKGQWGGERMRRRGKRVTIVNCLLLGMDGLGVVDGRLAREGESSRRRSGG